MWIGPVDVKDKLDSEVTQGASKHKRKQSPGQTVTWKRSKKTLKLNRHGAVDMVLESNNRTIELISLHHRYNHI